MENYICIDGKKIAISCETAKNLKQEFGKEEKPELRHGDYGYDKNGIGRLVIDNQGSGRRRTAVKNGLWENLGDEWPANEATVLGNIFDDLKRNAEDLEEFCRKDLDTNCVGGNPFVVKIEGSSISFRLPKNYCAFGFTEAQEIHRKLGQLIATAQRQQAKRDC